VLYGQREYTLPVFRDPPVHAVAGRAASKAKRHHDRNDAPRSRE
jgi:hypothetical protein